MIRNNRNKTGRQSILRKDSLKQEDELTDLDQNTHLIVPAMRPDLVYILALLPPYSAYSNSIVHSVLAKPYQRCLHVLAGNCGHKEMADLLEHNDEEDLPRRY